MAEPVPYIVDYADLVRVVTLAESNAGNLRNLAEVIGQDAQRAHHILACFTAEAEAAPMLYEALRQSAARLEVMHRCVLSYGGDTARLASRLRDIAEPKSSQPGGSVH